MGKQILKIFAVLAVLGIIADMPLVVMQAATHCEIKLAWGQYMDVTGTDWAKDWVKGCKEAGNPPKSELNGKFDHIKISPMTPGKY